MAAIQSNKGVPEDNHSMSYQDPAEFLLSEKQYHDWTVTIVDKKTNKVEEVFGVQSIHLIAHSSVFRTMMSDPKWVQTKTVEISDVRAEIFKLMLRYVYGGKLPEMSRTDAVELAFTADKYFMPRLVNEAGKQLIPTTLEEFYPGLNVAGYFSCPDLESHLVKYIQENTGKIIASEELLELPGQCWAFILKQEKLNVEEVDLWKHLLKWAEHQVKNNPEKTLRGVLEEPLKYLRLAAMSQEDIAREVLPTKVLTDSEMLSLFNAVVTKQSWDLPGLCNISTKRKTEQIHVFKALGSYDVKEYPCDSSSENSSKVVIKPLVNIELHSFMVLDETKVSPDVKANSTSEVTYNTTLETFASSDQLIALTPRQSDGSFLRLDANRSYKLTFNFPSGHKATHLSTNGSRSTYYNRIVKDVMTITYDSKIHVREIHYRILG